MTAVLVATPGQPPEVQRALRKLFEGLRAVEASQVASTWTPMPIAEGWNVTVLPGQRISGNVVFLRGTGTTDRPGTVMTRLPLGRRPSQSMTFPIVGGSVHVAANGDITPSTSPAILDGVVIPI
jgi:hypothetical protein